MNESNGFACETLGQNLVNNDRSNVYTYSEAAIMAKALKKP